MSQSRLLVETLKQVLKSHGIKYKDVAEHLKISEVSVRRVFSDENFSIERFEQICGMLGMEISDLVHYMETNTMRLNQLQVDQEAMLAEDPILLLICNLILNGWKYEDIKSGYNLDEPTLIRYLMKLSKIGIIELLPLNRIRLLVSPSFSWRADGPVLKMFLKVLAAEFFEDSFDGEAHTINVVVNMVSKETAAQFKQKIRDLEKQFIQQSRQDRTLPVTDRMFVGFVMGMRPWKLRMYDNVRKN